MTALAITGGEEQAITSLKRTYLIHEIKFIISKDSISLSRILTLLLMSVWHLY